MRNDMDEVRCFSAEFNSYLKNRFRYKNICVNIGIGGLTVGADRRVKFYF